MEAPSFVRGQTSASSIWGRWISSEERHLLGNVFRDPGSVREWPSGTGRDEVQRYVRFMQIYPVGSAVSTTKCVPLSWVSRPNSHGRAHGPDKPNRSSIPSSTTLARWGN